MAEQDPGWFYIGNGQLRYKDVEGWTDQYQDLDGPPKAPDVVPDLPEPAIKKPVRVRRKLGLAAHVRGWASTSARIIAARYREALASSSRRATARRPRHRGDLSSSSVVRSQLRQTSLARRLKMHRDRKGADDAMG